MKKLLLLPTTILLSILLSACTDTPMLQPNENNMIIGIKNNANFEFNSLLINVYKNEELKMKGGMRNYDGSNIQKGATPRKEYLHQEGFRLKGSYI